MYKPEIGDVVKDNDYPVVVVDLKNYENVGSCSYDKIGRASCRERV